MNTCRWGAASSSQLRQWDAKKKQTCAEHSRNNMAFKTIAWLACVRGYPPSGPPTLHKFTLLLHDRWSVKCLTLPGPNKYSSSSAEWITFIYQVSDTELKRSVDGCLLKYNTVHLFRQAPVVLNAWGLRLTEHRWAGFLHTLLRCWHGTRKCSVLRAGARFRCARAGTQTRRGPRPWTQSCEPRDRRAPWRVWKGGGTRWGSDVTRKMYREIFT